MKQKQNNIVGSKVRIDWPIRWHPSYGWKTQNVHLANAKEDAKKEKLFGREGEIISYDTSDDRGEYFRVKLEDGTTHKIPEGAFTVLEGPSPAGTRLMKLTGITGGTILINPAQLCWAEEVQSPVDAKKQCVNAFTAESDTELKLATTLADFQTEFAKASAAQ